MKIVINSHIKGCIARDHLIDSMKLHPEYKEYTIIVVIGGYYDIDDYEIEVQDNTTYIKCNHNSIDLTGLIALSELYKQNVDDHYLYLHDTCRVGQTFFEKIKNIATSNLSSMKINRDFSMNMGIYSQKIINQFSPFLHTRKCKNENRVIEYKSIAINEEDYIFRHDLTNTIMGNYDGWNKTGPTDYYGTGTMRIVEYYPYLDLYKIKANWGQGSQTLNV